MPCRLKLTSRLLSLQGIFGLPKCTSANNTLCETMRSLLELGAYLPLVQNRLVQAQYWHDPEKEARYAKDNVFLPGINNQAAPRNPDFAKRLMSREFP
jgi:palmitoyl-protein thioesterase